ncbi:LolA-like protein [Streptomyces sparsus]
MQRASRGNRIGTAVVAGVASGVLLAGCGGGDGSGDAADTTASSTPRDRAAGQAVTAAHQKTLEAETAELKLTVDINMEGRKQTVEGDGRINLRDGTSTMRIGPEGQRMEQRIVDTVLYQKPPEEQRGGMPDGKSWIRIDLEKLQGEAGGGNSVTPNPADSLDYLKALSEDSAGKVGSEKVAGVNTTHYEVTVDVRALAAGDASTERQLTQQLGESVPMEVWLDDEGRVRRQQVDVTVPSTGGQSPQGGTIRTVLELSDFGTEVDVSAPDAASTVDVTDRVAGQGPQYTDPAGPGN